MSKIAKPANQPLRIALLRILFVMLLPLLFLVEPAYGEDVLIGEGLEPLGALMIIAGVLGRFWAILYIGGHKNKTVMTMGPYSVCRHPLYLFSTIATFGLGLLLGSVVLALILGGLTFAILMRTALEEETFLRAEFGTAYDEYAKRVPTILPKPSLFQTPPEVVFSTRHLRVNLMDALVFLAFIPLAESIDYLREVTNLPSIYLY